MLATFAFDVCHDVYCAAREAIDSRIPTLNAESSGKYLWRPDRLPRMAEFVCDFALAGERALGGGLETGIEMGRGNCGRNFGRGVDSRQGKGKQAECSATSFSEAGRVIRTAMFRVYYLGGAEYQAARRHLGISELTWADWAGEIRGVVGRELTRSGMFPPSKYFRESAA